MQKSILLLFLLLIACTPALTVTPTAVPPTATRTPSPTSTPTFTPEPTATPQGFQNGPNGVQVYINGRWVDLPIPDTIWGDKPEGAKIILKDNEAVLEMKLINFQTQDGSKAVDVAKFNKDFRKWEVAKDLTIMRVLPLNNVELYDRNYGFTKASDSEARVDGFGSRVTIMGLRLSEEGNSRLDFLVLYKKHLVWISPDEISEWVRLGAPAREVKNVSFDSKIDILLVMELLMLLDLSSLAEQSVTSFADFFELQSGANSESCAKPVFNNDLGNKFRDWCNNELQKGVGRSRPNKDNIDWIFKGGDNPDKIDGGFDLNNLSSLSDAVQKVGTIDGTYFFLSFTKQTK